MGSTAWRPQYPERRWRACADDVRPQFGECLRHIVAHPLERRIAADELEITDVNRTYLERGDLFVEVLGRGFAWLDTGTHASLVEASHFVQILEQRQGLRIACLEEIALRLGYISRRQFHKLALRNEKSSYGEYLISIYDQFPE